MARNKSHKHVLPTRSKLKKDPGVPKLPDLKMKKSTEDQRRTANIAQAKRKDADSTMAVEPTLSSLALLAESTVGYSQDDISDPSSSVGQSSKAQMKKHYIRTLHKVIDESDIILLVLDARDPEGCRSRLVEEEVRRREHEGKKLVFVLNKIDLIPRSNAEAWLRYLRHSTPTLPFRSSTQQQRSNLVSRTSPALLNLLKSYKKGGTSITVGVVGYPNVGKSSLINSLKRAKVCAVAAEAGHTKEMQSVQVERGVRILDSPGVVFDTEEQESNNVLLRNVVKVEDIDDPNAVVDQILVRTQAETLQRIYNLPEFVSTQEFLTMLALSNGRLHKGGAPDILAAARMVIVDWNSQKIPYFSTPPTIHPSSVPAAITAQTSAKYGIDSTVAPGAEDVGKAEIVTDFAPAFDLAGLFNQADDGAFGNGDANMEVEDKPQEQETDDMIQDDLPINLPRKRSRSPSPPLEDQADPNQPSNSPNETTTSTHTPKRLKKEKDAVPTYDISEHLGRTHGLASTNPLNRKSLKKDAKRTRKALRKAVAKEMQVDGDADASMELAEEGLQFTFIANPNGVIV